MKMIIVADYFLPGSKAGGPIRSIANFVDNYRETIELFVFTRDRDFGDSMPYSGGATDAWVDRYGVKVYYCSPGNYNARNLRRISKEISADALYLNSMMSVVTRGVLLYVARGIRLAPRVILATRGELNSAALSFKRFRKVIYLKLMRALRVDGSILFHASSELERDAITSHFPAATVSTAMPIPRKPLPRSDKRRESVGVRFIFASRVSRMKNLKFLLGCLSEIKEADWSLKIHGAIDDQDYWDECIVPLQMCGGRVEYCGAYDNSDVRSIYANADFMLLPTLGENFGHSIYESAVYATPFVISDQTPWGPEKCADAGLVVPLEASAWTDCLGDCCTMPKSRYEQMSDGCLNLASAVYEQAVAGNNAMLNSAGVVF